MKRKHDGMGALGPPKKTSANVSSSSSSSSSSSRKRPIKDEAKSSANASSQSSSSSSLLVTGHKRARPTPAAASKEYLRIGNIVMVLYGKSQWAKAKIHQHVSTGIRIQWIDGAATQLIETAEVDVRIREAWQRKKSIKVEAKEHLRIGNIVMVLYGKSQWAKAKIHQHVSTGIRIQWIDGAATQLIETAEVDVRIREVNVEANVKSSSTGHNLNVEPKRKKQKLLLSNNTSGKKYKGVTNRPNGRYQARIGTTKTNLGTFDTAIKAALAYDQAAIKAGYKSHKLNFPERVAAEDFDVEPKRKKQKLRSDNTTGYRGVTKPGMEKFIARISVGNGQQKGLGTFDTAIQAALAYDQAAIKAGYKSDTLNFPERVAAEDRIPWNNRTQSSSSSSSLSSSSSSSSDVVTPGRDRSGRKKYGKKDTDGHVRYVTGKKIGECKPSCKICFNTSSLEDGSMYGLPNSWSVQSIRRNLNQNQIKKHKKNTDRRFLAPSGEIFRSLVAAKRFVQSNTDSSSSSAPPPTSPNVSTEVTPAHLSFTLAEMSETDEEGESDWL